MTRKSDGFFREIMESAVRQGWRVEKTQKGHLQFIPPSKGLKMVVTAGTPSDSRGVKNFLSDLRRSGFQS